MADWSLYDELLSGVPEGIQTQKIVVGTGFAAVQSESGAVGLGSYGWSRYYTRPFTHPGDLSPLTLRELAELIKSWNPLEAAVGQAAKNGEIVKSGEALERMGQVDLVAFDKTGTLTSGLLAVSDVFPCLPDWTERDVLALAASAEARSEHPLGQAIVACARLRGVTMETVSDFVMEPGRGIRGRVGDRAVLCGTAAFAEQCGMMVPDVAVAALERFRRQGKAAVLVMADGRAAGVVALSDTVRRRVRLWKPCGGMVSKRCC